MKEASASPGEELACSCCELSGSLARSGPRRRAGGPGMAFAGRETVPRGKEGVRGQGEGAGGPPRCPEGGEPV